MRAGAKDGAVSTPAVARRRCEAAPAPAPAEPGEPEMKPLPRVDVRRMTCGMLNSASDDDKAYASTFLLGYRSGLERSHILDTKQIDAVETAALADCASKPDEIASKVFATAQRKVETGNAPPRLHRAHRMRAPVTPTAAPGPTEGPAMRYAPAENTPAPETPAPGTAVPDTTAPETPAPKAPAPETHAEPPAPVSPPTPTENSPTPTPPPPNEAPHQ